MIQNAPAYNACHACGASLSDNQFVKDARNANSTAAWAKGQLRILAEMAADHGLPSWFAAEVTRICNGIELLPESRST